MYAVIETGGKQYRVELGTELAVERLDAAPGSTINFERVLLVADGDAAQVGTPTVADALVTADVLRQDRGEKLVVFKYRPKARHRAKKGHRQEQTVIRVADIRFNGRSAADEAGKERKADDQARKQAQAEAERKAAADQALAAKLAQEAAAAEKEPVTAAKPKTARTTRAAAPKAESAPAPAKAAAKPAAAKPAAPTKEATSTKTTRPAAKAAPKAADADKAAEDKPKTTRARSTRSSSKKDE